MPIISVPDDKFTQFIEKDAESKRIAQKKKELKEYPPQAVLKGSPTREWDNDLTFLTKLDREEVGSPNPPTFWALEIARAIRDYQGTSGKDVYDSIIENAKQKGLNKAQQDAIDQILLHWRVPVPGLKAKEGSEEKDVYSPVESDSTISFPQRQVAASLKASRELKERVAGLEQIVKHYNVHRASLRVAFNKQAIKDRVAQLLKVNFSRQDIASDMANWDFPKDMLHQAMAALLPKKIALSNGKRVSLVNDAARNASKRKAEASKRLSKHLKKKEGTLTDKQKLRLSALATKYDSERIHS